MSQRADMSMGGGVSGSASLAGIPALIAPIAEA